MGFEFDARYGNHDDKAYDQMYLNGSELNVFYYTDLNKNTLLLAGNSFDFTSEGLVFIPFVRLNYTFDNGFYINGRYKWKLWDYSMKG
ncbi:oligogalacturonate-specific porin KdgM family protein [Edwardsiella piscicida]|nr:oligogalacturonate-specific porin KdgM family protein [Edwardsiella piscicida]